MIVLSVVSFIVVFIFAIKKYIRYSRKKMISKWKVGDVIYFKKKVWVNNTLGIKQARLVGWNLDYFFIEYGDNNLLIEYKQLDVNKSANWRGYYENCEKTMGTKPSFNPIVKSRDLSNQDGGISINGKRIDLLTETECQVYLKQCIEEEKYELAELIKKQMEKYR